MKVNSIKHSYHKPIGNIYHPEQTYKKPKKTVVDLYQDGIILTELEYTVLQCLSEKTYTINELFSILKSKKYIIGTAITNLSKKHLIQSQQKHNKWYWYLTQLGINTILGEIIHG